MIPWWEMGLRLVLAAALSGVIGINREHHEWAAGLRTHMLVCVGAVIRQSQFVLSAKNQGLVRQTA